MNSSVPYSVPHEPGKWMAILLAVLVHALLLAFLWIGINWANNKPETFEPDSVWSEHDLEKAPPPVQQPEPEPEAIKPPPEIKETPVAVDPEIAIDQEKKRLRKEKEKHDAEIAQKEEDRKLAEEKKEIEDKKKTADEKRKQDALDTKKLALQRAAEVKRITAENGNIGSTGAAPRSQSNQKNASWIARVTAKVKSNIIGVTIPSSSDGNDPAMFEVALLPDGSVAGIHQNKSSGIPAFDEAVKRAIYSSQPYPADSSGIVPHSFISNNKPKDQ